MGIEETLHKRYSFLLIDQDISKGMQIWRLKDTNNNVYILKKIINCQTPLKELSTINSPHIPSVIEWYIEDNVTYIIENFIHGKRLDEINHISIEKIKNIVVQICEALNLIHEKKIIHRDLRFKNILVENDGNVVLINFENATYIQSHDNTKTYRDTRDLGSIEFSAPEQFCKGKIDERTDIFSLGIIFKSILETINDDLLIRKYGYLINKCTEFDPKYRFQSVMELKDEIQYEYLKKEILRKHYTYKKKWYLYFFIPYFMIVFFLLLLLISNYWPTLLIPSDRNIYIDCSLFIALPFSILYIINKQYTFMKKNKHLSILINGFVCTIYYLSSLYLIIRILYDGDSHTLSETLGKCTNFIFISGIFISFIYGYLLNKMQFNNIGE